MSKRITVLLRGKGNKNVNDIEISKGTTGKDIKRDLKVPDSFQVYRSATKTFLSDSVDLHSVLQNGEKVELSMEAVLGV